MIRPDFRVGLDKRMRVYKLEIYKTWAYGSGLGLRNIEFRVKCLVADLP